MKLSVTRLLGIFFLSSHEMNEGMHIHGLHSVSNLCDTVFYYRIYIFFFLFTLSWSIEVCDVEKASNIPKVAC
jgi:hypothetical protein